MHVLLLLLLGVVTTLGRPGRSQLRRGSTTKATVFTVRQTSPAPDSVILPLSKQAYGMSACFTTSATPASSRSTLGSRYSGLNERCSSIPATRMSLPICASLPVSNAIRIQSRWAQASTPSICGQR